MLLQQMTETQQCGRIRHALDGQIDTDEVAHRLAVVDGVLQRFIGKGIPLLEEVDAQHALQAIGGRPRLPVAFGKQEGERASISRRHGTSASI